MAHTASCEQFSGQPDQVFDEVLDSIRQVGQGFHERLARKKRGLAEGYLRGDLDLFYFIRWTPSLDHNKCPPDGQRDGMRVSGSDDLGGSCVVGGPRDVLPTALPLTQAR